MSGYLTYLMGEAHEAELAERARRLRPTPDTRTDRRRPNRVRISTARFLVAVAIRLDDRLQPTPVRAATSPTGT
jgi:hypothetical protein